MINFKFSYFWILFFLLFCCFFGFFFQKNIFCVGKKDISCCEYKKSTSKELKSKKNSQLINVKTDLLSLDINLLGGNIEHAELLKYRKDIGKKDLYVLLNNKKDCFYKMKSGIFKKNILHNKENDKFPLYSVSSVFYTLKRNQKKINICLTYIAKDGLIYRKVFFLTRGSYKIKIKNYILNNTNQTINAIVFGELQRNISRTKKNNILRNFFSLKTFKGMSYSIDKKKYTQINFNDSKNIGHSSLYTNQGWIAMQQQYFLTVWIPSFSDGYMVYFNKLHNHFASIGFFSSNKRIMPHSSYSVYSKVWIGPDLPNYISLLAKNIHCTMHYGWLWLLSKPLFQLLSIFYKFFKNWGISIVLITCFIKILTYPLIKLQYLNTIKIKNLQFKINVIKKKFFNNSIQMNQEILLLYKKKNINPFSGFIPILIQMPIFLALYYVLISAIELRHAPFFLWIRDLSSYDPFFVLPILTGFSVLILQISNESNKKISSYNKFLLFFPILSAMFFLWFPSGLVLYYLINNIVTIIQQYFIKKFFIQNTNINNVS